MYKCCITGKIVNRCIPANKVILAIRPVRYKHLYQGGPNRKGKTPEGPKLLKYSNGWEITKEGFASLNAINKAPKLEDLIEGLKNQEPIERVYIPKKKPKKKGKYTDKPNKVFQLKIAHKKEINVRQR